MINNVIPLPSPRLQDAILYLTPFSMITCRGAIQLFATHVEK